MINMKQPIPLCIKIGKRLTSTATARASTMACTRHTDTTIESKPVGWDAAKPYQSIPGPKSVPFIGNIWRFLPFIGDLHGYDAFKLTKLFYEKYGNIARLSGLKLPDVIMIYALDDIEHLFRNEGIYPVRDTVSKSFGYYRKNVRPEIFQGYAGVGEVQGKAWHDVRSKINPIVMNPQTVLRYVGDMDRIAAQLVEKMRHLAKLDPLREMPDNFIKCIYAWALESIMVVCLNKQLGCLEVHLPDDSEPAKIIEAATEIFNLFYKIEKMPSFKNIYKTKTWGRFVELMDFLTFTFLKHLKDSKSKIGNKDVSSESTTILEQLLKVDEKLVISTAMDFLTAGVDTTGKIVASALYYLARTPDSQRALRDELKTLLPNKESPITKEVLSNASYLRAVMKETTRIAPIGTGTPRQTAKDMVLCGYQIPKGTNILSSNLVLCHSEENYKHAKQFIPERWLRSSTGDLSVKSTNPFVSLPFGFGPRSCIGKRLATLELEIVVAKVIRNFYLEWHYQEAAFRADPFYGIKDPLRIRINEVEQ